MKKLAIPLVMVVLVAGACWSLGSDDVLADMEIRRDSGKVFVHRGDEVISVGDERLPLELNDVIKTGGKGFATLRLEDKRELKMQPAAQVIVDSAQSIESEQGSVLVDSPVPISVTFADTRAHSSDAVFRIDNGFGSARTATYSGRVELASAGQARLEIEPLFEATVAAGDLPPATEPYRLDESDPWDLDLLQKVVRLEDELNLLRKGFTRQLGRDRPGLAYFRALSGGKEVSFMRSYLRRRPADLLIGFAVAENDRDQSLKESFKDAFGYYDAGATWGITAAIMKVEPRPLVAQLKDVIVVAAGGAGEGATFTVAAAQAVEEGVPFNELAGPSDDDNNNQDNNTNENDDDDNNNDDDNDGNQPPEECEQGDVECVVRRAISPSPSPSDLLDGSVGSGDGR